jgi:hypothetical protein
MKAAQCKNTMSIQNEKRAVIYVFDSRKRSADIHRRMKFFMGAAV